MNADTLVEAGSRLLLRVALIVLGLWLLYLLRDIVLIIFAAVITSAALVPPITRLRRFGLSKTPSVLLVYLGLFIVSATLVGLFIPIFFSELQDFGNNFSTYSNHFDQSLLGLQKYLSDFGIIFDKEAILASLQKGFTTSFQGIFSTTVGIFQSMIAVFGFFFLSLYLSLEENGIEKLFRALTPKLYQAYVLSVAERIQGKVSQWLFAQFLMMILIFGIYYVGFLFLGLPYALALAFFGGLLEIIPYVGPIVAAIPAILLALFFSPLLAFSVLLFCFLVHQVEVNFLAPQIMKRSAGLSPVVVIIAVLAGAKLGGPIGVLVSIPTAMILSVFVEDFLEKKQIETQEMSV